jgi:DNA-binding transcriptional regulator YiaG
MTTRPPSYDPLRLNPTARRERLNLLAAEFHLTNVAIARIVGRTPQAISTWRNGRHQVPEPSLRLLELELGTREPRGIAAAEP